jgi:hypothetical protein
MLRIQHCLDKWLTDGSEVVRLTQGPCLTLQKHFLFGSGTDFCWRLSTPQGLVWPEGLGELIKFSYLNGSQAHDLPACSIAPQTLCYRMLP